MARKSSELFEGSGQPREIRFLTEVTQNGPLKGICDCLIQFSSLFIFGFVSLAWTCVSAVLYLVLPQATGVRAGRAVIHYLFRFFLWYTRAIGGIYCDLDELNALNHSEPVVIAPNHLSLLDAIFVIARVPNVTCIMKAKIWDNPILGGGARLAGYIRNDAPASMVKQAAHQLHAGHHLLVFPEGTRVVRPPVNPFKGGFALVAKRSGAPVQTVLLEADSPFLGKGWPLWRKPRFPLHYRLRLGQRFVLRPDEDSQAFVARLREYYGKELAGRVPVVS